LVTVAGNVTIALKMEFCESTNKGGSQKLKKNRANSFPELPEGTRPADTLILAQPNQFWLDINLQNYKIISAVTATKWLGI
jgi:hypothetical protein